MVSLELEALVNEAYYQVFDYIGKEVLTQTAITQNKTNINLCSVPGGLYFIHIQVGDQKLVKRMILSTN
ncbi:MAG: hypothetical protein ACI83I_002188 [Bacteroidia bacterium]|jgi:hypothetical protein